MNKTSRNKTILYILQNLQRASEFQQNESWIHIEASLTGAMYLSGFIICLPKTCAHKFRGNGHLLSGNIHLGNWNSLTEAPVLETIRRKRLSILPGGCCRK